MLFEDEELKVEEETVDSENQELEDENSEKLAELAEKSGKLQSGIVAGLSDVNLTNTVKESFLDYAMSVIVSRAIPDVRDGFKPVHRRIIYGMNESGMYPNVPHKKCARIVGDVMGKYHPHGDAAIYQSLVRMAQPFSMRYTLVDGHGNFGTLDGDEAAAMRYTEARMSKLSLEMVRDINCNTVDFIDNYDGSEKEPTVLPSRFPNLLVNGSSGIAVGMATNIPPHNLGEIIDGVVALAHNPEIDTLGLMEYIKGPDFPTGALILGKSGIRDAYETGTGSITIRSKAHIEERGEHGTKRIVIDEIPYAVNKSKIVENIAELARDKVIEGISDIRDETNKEGIRVVIDVKRDTIPEVLLNQLYKNTQLQTSYGIIMLCLIDNAPKVASLKEMLNAYLDFQVEVIERRTRFLLAKDEARDHIVVGLLKCHDNIDEIIDIIKTSDTPDEAGRVLIEKFGFDDPQVKAIMDMNLRRLTGIETHKLEAERSQLEANIANYKDILSSREKEVEVVVKELLEIKEKYGDKRRTEITAEVGSIDDEDLIPQEDIIIALTRGGYIKRLTSDTFRTQNRGGRGVRGMTTNENDVVDFMLFTNTHIDLMFFTNFGKVYRLRGHEVPEYARVGKGIPVVNLINIEKDEKVMSIIEVDEYNEDKFLMFVTKEGIVKRTAIKEYESIRQNGKIAITLRDGDELLNVKIIEDDTIVGIAASNGKMVNFYANEVRPMGRTASGVKGIELDEGDEAVGVTTSKEGLYILAITDKGYGKLSIATDYRKTKRGAKGVATIKATDKVGQLVSVRAVDGNEDLLVITKNGVVIRTPIEQIRIAGRNTQGVKIINLEARQKVSYIAIVPHEDEEEEELPSDPLDEGSEPVVNEEASFENDTALNPSGEGEE